MQTRKMWDAREKEYIFDHGWKINKEGKIELTRSQFNKCQYSGTSIRNPEIKTLMIPTTNGCALIFEHKHFEVI